MTQFFPGFTKVYPVTRTVRIDPTLEIDVQAGTSLSTVKGVLARPRSSPSRPTDNSPRQSSAHGTFYWEDSSFFIVPELLAGDRVQIDGQDWELITGPQEMRLGMRVVGHNADVLQPEVLWPLTATLRSG
jgi:hypothetical protein